MNTPPITPETYPTSTRMTVMDVSAQSAPDFVICHAASSVIVGEGKRIGFIRLDINHQIPSNTKIATDRSKALRFFKKSEDILFIMVSLVAIRLCQKSGSTNSFTAPSKI